jgi:hypothetical protein
MKYMIFTASIAVKKVCLASVRSANFTKNSTGKNFGVVVVKQK